MLISVFYSLNHHCFRCRYDNRTSYYYLSKNHIDKFNRMFIQNIIQTYSSTNKKIFSFKKYKESFKRRIGIKILNLGNKLLDIEPHKPKSKNNWYMWRK